MAGNLRSEATWQGLANVVEPGPHVHRAYGRYTRWVNADNLSLPRNNFNHAHLLIWIKVSVLHMWKSENEREKWASFSDENIPNVPSSL